MKVLYYPIIAISIITLFLMIHDVYASEPTSTNYSGKFSENHTVQYGPNFTNTNNQIQNETMIEKIMALDSPLEQFKSGITIKDIKCTNSQSLIIKSEDGTPACVQPETTKILLERGWAIAVITGITRNEYHSSCDTPYYKSDTEIPALYMPANSIGKLCVKYTNYNSFPDSFRGGIRIFDPNNSYQSVPDVTTGSNLGNITMIQGGESFTVTYWIKTGNHTGFYGLDLFCGGTPFAIGYDNSSKLVANDFPFVGLTYSCHAIAHDTEIDSMSGIGVKYIPYP